MLILPGIYKGTIDFIQAMFLNNFMNFTDNYEFEQFQRVIRDDIDLLLTVQHEER